jgi:hypothetical protein
VEEKTFQVKIPAGTTDGMKIRLAKQGHKGLGGAPDGDLLLKVRLAPDVRFGILPKGRILQSPCHTFYLQLIEPEPGVLDVEDDECLQRIGLGTPDVPAAVDVLRKFGVEFVAPKDPQQQSRGALARTAIGGAMFELVQHVNMAPTLPAARGSLPPEGEHSALGRPGGGTGK